MYDYINSIVDERGQVDLAFLDLSKAFDSVSHQLLSHKLKHFGINGNLLCWLTDYLSNRKQQTVVDESTSDQSDVQSGVPQGSILGPLLFLLYINDLPTVINDPNSFIAMYADDAKIYKAVNSAADTVVFQERCMNVDLSFPPLGYARVTPSGHFTRYSSEYYSLEQEQVNLTIDPFDDRPV